MKVNLSILIPVYNGLEFTKKCLADLESAGNTSGSPEFSLNTIIIDDGSKDGTAEWVKVFYPHVHVIVGNGSLWWSGAINEGITYAIQKLNSNYVLLWNNDIRPNKGYFDHIYNFILNQPECPIIISAVYFEDKPDTLISMGGLFNRKTGKKIVISYGKKESEIDRLPERIDWFGGMGTVIHESVFEKIGLFDNINFPQYHGDSDFGLRATKAGFRIQLNPDMKIWNDTSNTGYNNNSGLKEFFQSLTSLKSNFNIKKDILFHKIHGESIWSYQELFKRYFIYLAGFIKRKILPKK